MLLVNLAKTNKYCHLELSRAWEPSNNSWPLHVGEGKEAQSSIFDGNSLDPSKWKLLGEN